MAFIPQMFAEHFRAPDCPRRRHVVGDLTEDILNSIAIAQAMFGPEYPRNHQEVRNMSSTLQQSGSSVSVDKDKFQVNFDVQHFKPEEITVKVTGNNSITIDAKHEEKPDEHGHIYRHFIRKYVLPENCDIEKVESRLSSDGVLTITAPTVSEKTEYRIIPITPTRQPVMPTEEMQASEEDQPT